MKVKLDNSRLNNIISNAETNTENFVNSVAFSVEREAKILVPVDTGALRNSIYTDTAKTANKPVDQDYELPRGNHKTAYVGPTMEYAIYVELGTNKMDAQPYLIPAVERIAHQLNVYYRLLLP